MSARASEAEAELRRALAASGYARVADLSKRKARGSDQYKKGYEVRFVVEDEAALARIRRLLKAAGFTPGKPFAKHAKLVQPVYGREAVERLRGGS